MGLGGGPEGLGMLPGEGGAGGRLAGGKVWKGHSREKRAMSQGMKGERQSVWEQGS